MYVSVFYFLLIRANTFDSFSEMSVARQTYPPLYIYYCDFKCFTFYQKHVILLQWAQSIKNYELLNTMFQFIRFLVHLGRQAPYSEVNE